MNVETAVTAELQTVVGRVTAPPPPATATLVRRAEQTRSRARLRRVGVVGLVAAAVVAAVVIGSQLGKPDASPVPTPQPTSLPTGAPPRVPYVSGSTLYLDGGVVPGVWGGVKTVAGTTLGSLESGTSGTSTEVIFLAGREVGRLTRVSSNQDVLLSTDGTKVVWVERDGQRFFLVVRDIPTWRELGRLEVDRSKLGHLGAENEGWETVQSVANDGTVTYSSVVVSHTWKPGNDPVDHAVRPEEPAGYPEGVAGVEISPDGSWGAWSTDRHGVITSDPDELAKTDGVTVQHPHQPASRFTIALPVDTDARALTWESTTDLLVTVFDDVDGTTWHFVRCSTVTRRCEEVPTGRGS